MRAVLLLALAALVAGCTGCGAAQVDPLPDVAPELHNAVERTYRVEIECENGDKSGGSAVYLGNRTALTAAHVVEGVEGCDMWLTTHAGERYPGAALAIDHDIDVALLVTLDDRGFWPTSLRDGKLGEPVYNAGFPTHPGVRGETRRLNITSGILAADYGRRARVTAPCFFGNSGGGSWSADGELLGLTVSGHMTLDGYCWITPAGKITPWLESMID